MNAPFQYGTLATKENFVDRVEDRAQLKNFLSSHINVMLVSPRRWGKSSLVKVAMDELQEEDKDVRVCYIDAFSIGSEAEFYRTFASQVIACASSNLEKRIHDAKKFLTGVVPQVVIKDDVTNFMAFDVKFIPQEQEKMDILRLPETLAQSKKIKIIVCIDEFQQLANLPEYKNMEGKMRSAWQQQERVSYCLYGSKRHMMLDIFNNSNSPFYRFGQLLFLNKIPKEEWMPFIVNTFEKSGKYISDEFASRICDVTECHSWYLQQCCYFVWNASVNKVTEESFNLAELERRTGVSRGKLRRLKRNGFQDLPRKTKGSKHKVTKLSGYTGLIDSLLKQGIKNSSVILDRLQQAGYEGGATIVKEYMKCNRGETKMTIGG